ncbi:AT-rich interactive domain-containing protein 4B-like isoform X1 [Vicugna pacos]|uniref:AT-rich interactive domain-containing protein 4B-like n=1 Tax=Vicugna pacos TaxID=30538 RepID=A0ABM5CPX0_VICPA
MKALHEPPYLTVGTDVSVKYRGAFCEAKIKTAKRLAKVKVTFRHDSSIVEVQDDHINGPLKVGAIVKVKNLDGAYQEAVINKLTDASWYTVGDYMLDTKPKEMPEIQRLNYEQDGQLCEGLPTPGLRQCLSRDALPCQSSTLGPSLALCPGSGA